MAKHLRKLIVHIVQMLDDERFAVLLGQEKQGLCTITNGSDALPTVLRAIILIWHCDTEAVCRRFDALGLATHVKTAKGS